MVPWWCMTVILLLVFLQSLAEQEGWGPSNANSSPHPRRYPCGWSPHKRDFGEPRPSPSHCVYQRVLLPRSSILNMGHLLPHSEIPRYFASRSELTCLMWLVQCSQSTLSLPHTKTHGGTEESNATKSTDTMSCAWPTRIHILLPPSSSSSHPAQLTGIILRH